MSEQLAPAASQRRHLRVYVIVGVPVHVPAPAVSVWPSCVVPLMLGSTVLTGGELISSATRVIAPGKTTSMPAARCTVADVEPLGRSPSAFITLASNAGWFT